MFQKFNHYSFSHSISQFNCILCHKMHTLLFLKLSQFLLEYYLTKLALNAFSVTLAESPGFLHVPFQYGQARSDVWILGLK